MVGVFVSLQYALTSAVVPRGTPGTWGAVGTPGRGVGEQPLAGHLVQDNGSPARLGYPWNPGKQDAHRVDGSMPGLQLAQTGPVADP